MGGLGRGKEQLLSIIRKANSTPQYRQQLEADPRQTLEREARRKLTDAELDDAMKMLKSHGLNFTAKRF